MFRLVIYRCRQRRSLTVQIVIRTLSQREIATSSWRFECQCTAAESYCIADLVLKLTFIYSFAGTEVRGLTCVARDIANSFVPRGYYAKLRAHIGYYTEVKGKYIQYIRFHLHIGDHLRTSELSLTEIIGKKMGLLSSKPGLNTRKT